MIDWSGYKIKVICPKCKGNASIQSSKKSERWYCSLCEGKGEVDYEVDRKYNN